MIFVFLWSKKEPDAIALMQTLMGHQKLLCKYTALLCASLTVTLCSYSHAASKVRRLGEIYNTQEVDSLDFSPGGRTLADSVRYIAKVGSEFKELGAVRLWNVQTGKRRGTLRTYAIARGVAWSPDGRLLATALELGRGRKVRGMVKVWDVKTSKVIAKIEISQGHAKSVAWTPDGTLIAAGCGDSRVRLWNWKANKIVRVLQGSGNSLTSLALSPNGRLLAAGSLYAQTKSARLWDINTGRVLHTWKDQGQVAFSPDGKWVATSAVEPNRKYDGSDALVRVWNVSTGKLGFTLLAREGESADAVAFAPKGLMLAVNGLNPTRLWDLRRNKIVQAFPPSTFSGPIAFSPDGKVLAQGTGDSSTYLFEVKP